MDLISAIKSSKAFKRKGWDAWHTEEMGSSYIARDIIADDYELQNKITITESQFDAAWERCMAKKFEVIRFESYGIELKKELGF